MEQEETAKREFLGGQMSFLEHLDEFRKRLVKSLVVVGLAFILCWVFSLEIYQFLDAPVKRALTQAQRLKVPIEGLTGKEKVLKLSQLKEGDTGRYVFSKTTSIGSNGIPAGTSVFSVVAKDSNGNISLFTDETVFTPHSVIPKGIKLPIDLNRQDNIDDVGERLILTTAGEGFTIYVTVSLYAAIALSVPFLLLQIWGFISPALYKHERKYVTPFVSLSSVSFILGAAFAYYIVFPAAFSYLLGLGAENFDLYLRAADYLDFIIIVMLAMGLIFQMPAVAYVLARIGLISPGLLVRSWKAALITILIVAAFVSPTGDALNLTLFATPMIFLYLVSILVAWIFGKNRESDLDEI